MRTSIAIDDQLMRDALRATGLKMSSQDGLQTLGSQLEDQCVGGTAVAYPHRIVHQAGDVRRAMAGCDQAG